ncbi:MAG: hypothetical protein NT108_02510 [Candidatus Kaiserbacteria bacterium]|nr:hypothetical protein [Candidatus Kaiserbacteria bacterium]
MRSSFLHLIFALGICAVVLIGYGFWYATIADMSASATVLQGQIDAKTQAVSRMATTRAALAEISDDEKVLQSYFVPETGVVAFIDTLEGYGRAVGSTTVEVLSVSTGGALVRPTLTFSLSITGSFDAVMRTVGAIEYAPYAISIADLSVGQNAKNNWHADLELLVASIAPSSGAKKTP